MRRAAFLAVFSMVLTAGCGRTSDREGRAVVTRAATSAPSLAIHPLGGPEKPKAFKVDTFQPDALRARGEIPDDIVRRCVGGIRFELARPDAVRVLASVPDKASAVAVSAGGPLVTTGDEKEAAALLRCRIGPRVVAASVCAGRFARP